jgi:ParB-like chromosome segregation protein Spo0J
MSKFQRFETETLRRSEIKGAPYNPRKINAANKRKLKNSLAKHGLVMPLVLNKRTGTLVSGHQRLKALDALEGTDDYSLTVAVIDVDEREEKIINVQINNEYAMGEWDLDALGEMKLKEGIEFTEMGFTEDDAALLFSGDERFTALFETPEYQEEAGKLDEIKKDRKEQMKKLQEQQTADFYFIVVCKDRKDREALMADIGYPPTEEIVHSDSVRRLAHNLDSRRVMT